VRADREISESDRRKTRALLQWWREEAVIPALDVETIYDVPVAYHDAGLDRRSRWRPSAKSTRRPRASTAGARSAASCAIPEGEVTIAIVGKYTGLRDAYKSLTEALQHGGIATR